MLPESLFLNMRVTINLCQLSLCFCLTWSVSVEDVLLAVGDQVGHAHLSYAPWWFWGVAIGV